MLFVVEDKKNNKFGGYVNAKIDKYNESIYDEHAFLFSLKRNGKNDSMKKFNVKNPEKSFHLLKKKSWWMVIWIWKYINE